MAVGSFISSCVILENLSTDPLLRYSLGRHLESFYRQMEINMLVDNLILQLTFIKKYIYRNLMQFNI